MKLCLINHNFKYELEKLIRIFLPFEKITFSSTRENGDNCAVTTLLKNENETVLSSELFYSGKEFFESKKLENNSSDYKNECERLLAVTLFNCFIKASGYTPQWGILTGVRPAKLFSRLQIDKGEAFADKWFKNSLFVNENKISLCKESVKGEEKIVSLSKPDSFSLYISVPFCPSRCTYCSFVSHSVEQAKKLIPQYVELLIKEIKETAKAAKSLNLRLETVYIGGGTPTALNSEQLQLIMQTVNESFNTENLREFTVEAGRPDTVTEEKLSAIKNSGATRISINPQTMNDAVLKVIGRRHTAEETVNAYRLARELGFDNINMDLIAGLPTDTVDSFKNTVETVLRLNPESVTVHSLSVKRSSTLTTSGNFPDIAVGSAAAEMVDYARKRFSENEIAPYYMYRQSKTVGNLENVGYAKKGFECLYNVYIMDETHSILACGASAVTKLREPHGSYIERIFNFKYPYEYIDRFDDILNRKTGIYEFYGKYPANYK